MNDDTCVQEGGVPGYSGCLEHTLVISQFIREVRRSNSTLSVLCLGLAKAYSRVPWEFFRFWWCCSDCDPGSLSMAIVFLFVCVLYISECIAVLWERGVNMARFTHYAYLVLALQASRLPPVDLPDCVMRSTRRLRKRGRRGGVRQRL